MRSALCLAIAWAVLLPALATADNQAIPDTAPPFTHTVAVSYGNEVSKTAAARGAEHLARSGVLQRAGVWLARQPIVAAYTEQIEKTEPGLMRDSVPLARVVYRTITIGIDDVGEPPELGVSITVKAKPVKGFRDALTASLDDLHLLTLHRITYDREQHLLRSFISTVREASMRTTPADALFRPFEKKLQTFTNKMQACAMYAEALKTLEHGRWQQPEKILDTAARALELDVENPLWWHATGVARYQLQQTQPAIDAYDRALSLAPDFAQALHDRATAYVRVHLTDLALEDYKAAIGLRPHRADYYRSRGSAYLVREEFAAMCSDFYTACTLGQCQNYHWAVSRDTCGQ